MIHDKYQYQDYLMLKNILLHLWQKMTYLSQDLEIHKEDPAMNRGREMMIKRVRDHIPDMKIELEKVIDNLDREIKEYKERREKLIEKDIIPL
jgi:hypothetical protein